AAHPVRRAERDRVLARAASAPIRHGPSREARNLPRLRSARASEKIAVRLRQRDPMAADLDSLDIISNDTYARNGYPHEAWTLLRREDPIHWNDRNIVNPFWAVTKHADIVWISKQPELFRNGPRLAALPEMAPPEGSGAVVLRHLLNMDPPDHGAFRKLATHRCTPPSLRRDRRDLEGTPR